MRTKGTLERDIMLGKVEGHRRQGRLRLCWIDSIKEATGLSLEVLKELVKDRKKWCRMVEEKTRNREQLNAKRTQEKAMANHS
jgi:CRISPR/Cas system-associated exonuclease Cas4 (RecB family)